MIQITMRKIMKQLLLLNIILITLSTPLQAATVKAFATNAIGAFGSFSAAPGGLALTDALIEDILAPASGPTTAIYGRDNPITVPPIQDRVSIDLDFGDTTVVTGSGVDLVIFSLMPGDYSFGLQVFGNNDTLLSNYNYDTSIHSTPVVFGSTNIFQTTINLFSNDNIPVALADDIELDYIRLFIGNDYNGEDGNENIIYSNFSLVGAFHTQTVVIPLPLSAVLFSSGLALLGWVGRRKTV